MAERIDFFRERNIVFLLFLCIYRNILFKDGRIFCTDGAAAQAAEALLLFGDQRSASSVQSVCPWVGVFAFASFVLLLGKGWERLTKLGIFCLIKSREFVISLNYGVVHSQ